jgi:hypothetical protein
MAARMMCSVSFRDEAVGAPIAPDGPSSCVTKVVFSH